MISDKILFFCGNGNHPTSSQIMKNLSELFGESCKFEHINFNKFPEGELDNRIPKWEKIKDKTVVVFQSFNDSDLLELVWETLDLVWALKHQYGAKKVIVVFLFVAFRRQDPLMVENKNNPWKKAKPDEIQRLRMFISLLKNSGVDEILTISPHSKVMSEICEEYEIIFKEINVAPIFANEVKNFIEEDDLKLVFTYAPDLGAIERAIALAKELDCSVMYNKKGRVIYNESFIEESGKDEIDETTEFLKEKYNFSKISYVTKEMVAGKIIILTEDEIASGMTANNTGQMLKKLGSKHNILCATHPLFTRGWRNKLLNNNPFYKILVSITIQRPYEKRTGGQLVDVPIDKPVSSKLFKILKDI